MDESTTDAPVQEQAALQPQPEEQHAEAETTPTSEPTNTNDEQQEATDEPEQSDNSEDDLADWAAKKGYDFSTPEGQAKALKSMREAESRMHQATQRSSELEKQLQSSDFEQVSNDPTAQAALEKAASVELAYTIKEWKRDNGITPDQDAAIGQYLQANQDKAYMLKNGYLSIDDVAAISGALKQDPTVFKAEGKRAALEDLRDKQRTTSPSGAATSTNRASGGNTIADLEERLSDVTF